jgi:hypothetical protein
MRKGGIEVSIGFLIVMIVAALTMIFIMGWITNMFPVLQDMGTYATESARKQMMDKFAEGTTTVLATIPTNKQFSPGLNVRFSIGVKKSSTVKEGENFFSMCIGKTGEEGCTMGSSVPVAAPDDEDLGIKFQFSPMVRIDNRGDVKTDEAAMQITAGNTELTGLHGYTLYVCKSENSDYECSGLADENYYGDYRFIVEIK